MEEKREIQLCQNIKDGWFIEKDVFNSGHSQCIEVEKILYHKKSKYQDVLVFKSVKFGNILVLDGSVQCSEVDEFAYQEMITFLPLNSHPNPSNVLVIGGGDGGVLRELLKHPNVNNITLCELDADVIQVSKLFLPDMSIGFTSSKLNLIIGDGFEHLRHNKGIYDVIICDLSDPQGDASPSDALYTKESIGLMNESLKEDGIVCIQAECIWTNIKLIKKWMSYCEELFPICKYSTTYVPTYPCGQIGFILCSKSKDMDFQKPILNGNISVSKLRYYSYEIHSSSFILPEFAKKELYEK